MSTGAECRFTEVEPGRWTYWLQDYPYGETERGATYGPFPSFGRAHRHLDENHGNPGGWSIAALPPGEHRHEWKRDMAQRVVGVTVSVDVESLGPDPDPAAVIALVRSLDTRHFALRPLRIWVDDVKVCDACGVEDAEDR